MKAAHRMRLTEKKRRLNVMQYHKRFIHNLRVSAKRLMLNRRLKHYGLLCLFLPILASADLVREWLTADEAARVLPQGEQIWLKSGSERFWAIYRETDRKESRGTAIVLSDPGTRPYSVNMVGNIAATLRQLGWQILLLQPPMADSMNYQHKAAIRLQSAIAYLAEKKHTHMALLGIGESALVTLEYAALHPPPPPPTPEELEKLRQNDQPLPQPPPGVRLAAVVDLPWNAQEVLAWLRQMQMPLADYYQAQDNASGLDDWAKQRRIAAKDNESYRQLRLTPLSPVTDADYAMLARRLVGWAGKAMRSEIDKWPKPETKAPAPTPPAPTPPPPPVATPAPTPATDQPPAQAPIQPPVPAPIQAPAPTEAPASVPAPTPTPTKP